MSEGMSPTREQATLLKARVFALVQAYPAGRVTTYGWIAIDYLLLPKSLAL